MSFIIGRGRYAREAYPETGGDGDATFARNSAYGPAAPQALVESTEVAINWQHIEFGGGSGIHVAVTPKVTGKIRMIAMIGIRNTSIDPATVNLRAAIGSGATPTPIAIPLAVASVDPSTNVEIPLVINFNLPVGVVSDVSIEGLLTSAAGINTIFFETDLCSIDIEELSVATG